MSKRELQKAGVLARVEAGELRLKDGAELMRISYRQAKRLWKRYRCNMIRGVVNTITAFAARDTPMVVHCEG